MNPRPSHASAGVTLLLAVALPFYCLISGCGSSGSTATPSTPSTPTSNVLLLDNFAQDVALNPSVWTIPQGAGTFFGRTQLRPPSQPPQVVGGVLRLALNTYNATALTPGDSFWGTEIDTVQSFSVGTGLAFKAKVRFEGAVPAGIVGSLFGYALNAAGTARDEIDVELLTTAPVGFLTNVYQAAGFSGAGTPQAVGSGSLTDFHTYEVDWFADHIVWLVDGTVVRTATSGIPTQPMTIRLNVWAPDSSFSQAFSAALAPVASPQQDQTYFYDVASVEIDRLSASVTRNRDFDRR